MSRRPTLVDVARACGLATATISRAFQPDTVCDLNPATRARILAAAAALGYRPNHRARSLVTGRCDQVALLHRGEVPYFRGSFESLGDAIAGALHRSGLQMILAPADGDQLPAAIAADRCDGCLVVPPWHRALPAGLETCGVPVVLVNLDDGRFDRVVCAEREAAERLSAHLRGRGHQRIGFWLGEQAEPHHSTGERLAGWRSVVGDRAAPLSGSAAAVLDRLRSTGCSAVLAYGPLLALALRHAAWEHGLRVPEDLAIATFGDFSGLAVATPPITAIRLPYAELGQRAVELLIRRIADPALPPERVELAGELVVRASG